MGVCSLMKYVDSKNVENFSQICKYEYKKNEWAGRKFEVAGGFSI